MQIETQREAHSKPNGIDGWLREQFRTRLQDLDDGLIEIQDPWGVYFLGQQSAPALSVRVQVHDVSFYRRLAIGGTLGAGEAYMEGLWQCDELTNLIRILVRNRSRMDDLDSGLARLSEWLLNGWYQLQRNTLSGSKRNIAAHYDLSNEFFSLFLDERMMYSSAIFPDPKMSLEAAQTHRLQTICNRLQLSSADHLVEIGTGWGGLAEYAAAEYGCRVTSITISEAQYAAAKTRISSAGLDALVDIRLCDYRELEGQYDKLVSIEMVEAVGHQYLDTYFERCMALLKPGGRALIQAITIEERRYEYALPRVDFIKRYIFPGSFIPCVSALNKSAAKASFELRQLDDFGSGYALTLRHWRQRFMSRLADVKALGFDDRFIRMWEFYLCYCEGGFAEKAISDVHMVFEKPAF